MDSSTTTPGQPRFEPEHGRPTGYYKVPIDRVFADKLWAHHVLTGKSVSRIVGEALVKYFHLTEEQAAALKSDDGWEPRKPRNGNQQP